MQLLRVLFSAICLFAVCAGSTVHAEELVPRTIIALYEGGPVQNSFIHSVAEMPLNHLGLKIEWHSVREPLPEITKRKDVRGVISWFYGEAYDDPETFLKWALDAIAAGKKFVIIGSVGVADDAKHYSIQALTNRFLNQLGLKRIGHLAGDSFDVTYDYRNPSMFLLKTPYDWVRPSGEVLHAVSDKIQVHLSAKPASGNSKQENAIIVTGPNGGYADAEYAIRTNKRDNYDITQWLINPFEFFRDAYDTDDLPKPDATTIAGRRMYYSNIDGDGWNNVTQLEQYRNQKVISAQVIYEKAIKPYPDLPVMVAPIAGDVDPAWVGSETARKVARDLWALPQVEAGTHTYSHPFYWGFFENGDPKTEIPYLRLYKTGAWQPDAAMLDPNGKSMELPIEFSVPRAFANQPFDLEKEIAGSIKFMQPLLPKGKKIDILAWSGDCMPWEDPIRLTRQAKVQNINGGDTRYDAEYPAYASVAPYGRQVGKELQIYNSNSNENTFTDLWMSNFHAFSYLRKTLEGTETPMRLSAMSIYYHMYSGEKEAALNALLANLNYARTLDIAPVTSAHYTRIAEGFYDTQLYSTGNDVWRVEKRGSLQTVRFDRSTLKSVDFDRSRGVIGERHTAGRLYVYLDANVSEPVIALKDNNRYWTTADASIPYLVESRWLITDVSRGSNRIEFNAQGYGAGEMVWRMPSTGTYRVTVNGESQKVEVKDDHLLRARIDEDAIHALKVTITESNG